MFPLRDDLETLERYGRRRTVRISREDAVENAEERGRKGEPREPGRLLLFQKFFMVVSAGSPVRTNPVKRTPSESC